MFVIFTKINKHKIKIYLPAQVVPLPEYPALQWHSNDPGLFVHVAFASHGDVDAVHSFISLVIYNKIEIYQYILYQNFYLK